MTRSDLNPTAVGDGDQLVLLVHGVLDRGASFSASADLLAADCRMEWYDRRGYGRSVDAPGVPAEIEAHMDDVVSMLDGRRAVVVGHSFGGVVAAGAAVRVPELVSALVLYESVLAWAPLWPDTVMRGLLAREDAEDAGLQMLLGGRHRTSSEAQRARLQRQARAFVVEERGARRERPPYDVAGLTMPVIYGSGDAFPATEAMVDLFEPAVADFELVLLPGADHNAHRTAPRRSPTSSAEDWPEPAESPSHRETARPLRLGLGRPPAAGGRQNACGAGGSSAGPTGKNFAIRPRRWPSRSDRTS